MKGQECYLVPFNILGGSNVIRNVLYSQKLRLFDDGTVEPMQEILGKALEVNFEQVAKNVEFSYGNFKGEVDVIATFAPYVFIFECRTHYPLALFTN